MGFSEIPCTDPEKFRVRVVGIVTALRVEARCLTPLRLPFNESVSLGDNAAIWLCGMGAKAAREAAVGLRADGATALMSFGVAGALDPGLRPGDLVLPESIHAGHLLPVDLDWRTRLQQQLSTHLNIAGGILAASSQVLTSAVAKRELAEATGACAVDMESGAVAEVAASAGVPFLAVRVITDPAEYSPPAALLAAVHPDGGVDLVRLLALLLRSAVTLSTLLRLAAEMRAARSTLSTVVRYGGTELGVAPARDF